MISRKIETEFRRFFAEDKRALLVTGARQTGKTFSIRRVAKDCFEQVIEINFYEQKDAVQLFSDVKNASDFLFRLSAFVHKPLVPGKTLIFFDEVQYCPEIVTMIKFLVDAGSYRYVLSGSLLGVALKSIRSVPVGYLDVMDMFPLDFEEFAMAIGIGSGVLSNIRECYANRKPVDAFVHNRMLDLVRLYLMVGGMPAAVQSYLDTNNMKNVSEVQRSIIRLYKMDIGQYDPDHKLQIGDIYDLIPAELNDKNKRFVLKDLSDKNRFKRYEQSFLWLVDAGVAIPTYCVNLPKSPLELSRSANLFKLFSNDVGLLACQYGGDIQIRLLNGDVNINNGAIFENFAAQELHAHGWGLGDDGHLFFYNNKKFGELDFVIEQSGQALPIEIKSGKDYHRHNALDNAMRNEDWNIPEAYVFCQDNLQVNKREDGCVTYLPIYMLMCLERTKLQDAVFKFDLNGLM